MLAILFLAGYASAQQFSSNQGYGEVEIAGKKSSIFPQQRAGAKKALQDKPVSIPVKTAEVDEQANIQHALPAKTTVTGAGNIQTSFLKRTYATLAAGTVLNESFNAFPPNLWDIVPPQGLYLSGQNLYYCPMWTGSETAYKDYLTGEAAPVIDGDDKYAVFMASLLYNYPNAGFPAAGSLITRPLMPTTANHILSFRAIELYREEPTWIAAGMELYIEVSTNEGTTWSVSTENVLTQIPDHNMAGAHHYATLTVDLTDYIDQTILVRFRAKGDYGGFDLGIDNITGIPLDIDPNPDLEIMQLKHNLPALSIPLRHADEVLPKAKVQNNGSDMTATAILNFTITPGTYTKDITIPVLTFDQATWVEVTAGNGFTPTSVNTYTITVNANLVDATPGNNIASTTFNITNNLFAADNGTKVSGVGNNSPISFGNVYSLKQKDVITAISANFNRGTSALPDKDISFSIYSVNLSEMTSIHIYTSPVFVRTDAMGNVMTDFPIEPTVLEPGDYLFTLNQLDNTNINCAYDGNPDASFYIRQSNGTVTVQEGFGAVFVRAKTGQVISKTPEAGAEEVEINAPVEVTFFENVTGSLTGITIVDDQSNAAGNVSANIQDNILTIAHDDFAYHTAYTVTIPVTAITGLTEEISWSFTTKFDSEGCNIPTQFEQTAIGSFEVTLSWVENGISTSWEVKYGAEGFDPETAGTLVTAGQNPYTLPDLNETTTYDVYVRSICSGDTYSGWAGPVTFTTVKDCTPPVTLPFTENFEGTELNPCWSNIYTANTPGFSTTTAHGGTKSWRFSSFTEASNYNQYLITPALPATSVGKVVQFFYNSLNRTEKFRVGYSITDNDTGSFIWVDDITAAATNGWVEYTNVFPSAAKYVAINYYSSYQYYLYVDDFTVSEQLQKDATLIEFVDLDPIESGLTKEFKARLKNEGGTTLTAATIDWSIDGVPQTSFNWTGSLEYDEDTIVTLGEITVTAGTKMIAATVVLSGDENNTNDQIQQTTKFRNYETLPYSTEFDGSLDAWKSVSITGEKNWKWVLTDEASNQLLTPNSTTKSNGWAVFYAINTPNNLGPNPSVAALVSPGFDFTAVSGPIGMSFEHFAQRYDSATILKVQVSADNFKSDIQDIWTMEVGSVRNDNVGGKVFVNLSDYAGQTGVRVRFHFEGGGAWGWSVDDVNVYKITTMNDLSVINASASPVLYSEGEDVVFHASVLSMGGLTATNATVTFDVNGEDVTAVIPEISYGQIVDLTTTWENATAGAFAVAVSVPDDEDNTNNTATFNQYVASSTQLATGFEAGLSVNGWKMSEHWERITNSSASFLYEGSYVMLAGNRNTAYTDVKLETPLLSITSGDWIAFYAKYVNAPPAGQTTTLQIMYSTDRSNWLPIGTPITLTDVFTDYKVDLGITGNYYLAFNATGLLSGTYPSYTIVDHVIAPKPVVSEVAFTVKDVSDANPIEGATVTINGTLALPTNKQGVAAIELADGNYEYTVSKEGYFSITGGTFTIDNNVVAINVDMERDPATEVENVTSPDFNIYPNPVTDILYIDAADILLVDVYDMQGLQVISRPGNNQSVDMRGLASGSYVVIIYTADNLHRKVMMKK